VEGIAVIDGARNLVIKAPGCRSLKCSMGTDATQFGSSLGGELLPSDNVDADGRPAVLLGFDLG
jgi:hypothetical protein